MNIIPAGGFKVKLRFIFCAAALATTAISAHAEDIVIGVPASLTGPLGFIGTAAVKGMQMAVEEINAARELGPNRAVKLVVGDDAGDRNQSITLATRMARVDRALAIAGPTNSATSMAVAPVANQLRIPMVSIAVVPSVNKTGPWSNRVMSSSDAQMTAISRYLVEKIKPKTVMIVQARDNEGTVGQARAVREHLQGKVTLLPDESVLMADSDFTALATKIAFQNPDAVFIALSGPGTANLIMQARQAGVKPNVVFVGTTGPASPTYLKIGGRAVEGSYMVADAFPEARTDALAKNFVANYQKKYNEPWDQWAAIGYTIVRVIANGILTAKGPLTRESLNNAIVATRKFPTLLGNTPFGYDREREPTFQPIVLTVKDQKFQVAP